MAAVARFCLIGRVNLPQTCGALYTSTRHSSADVTLNKNVTLSNVKRGRGGRSSFSGVVCTVFGATGFVGRYVINRLGKNGSQVIIPYRGDQYDVDRLKILGDLGQILLQPYHLQDEESLRKCMQYSNVVINLIGRDYETKNFKFNDVHVEGPRRLARIAKECGVERFIHISALNAESSPERKVFFPKTGSRFLQSKYDGEQAVLDEFPEATILRPSDIIGQEDRFTNMYMKKHRWGRRIARFFLAYPNWIQIWKKGEATTKQPILVDDVVTSIMESAYQPETKGAVIDLVGPENMTLADWVRYIFECMGIARFRIAGCHPLFSQLRWRTKVFDSKINIFTPPFTLDRLEREITSDKVSKDHLTIQDLGITPGSVKHKMAYYIRPQARINYYRSLLGEEAPTALQTEPPSWKYIIGSSLAIIILFRLIDYDLHKHPLEREDNHYGQATRENMEK